MQLIWSFILILDSFISSHQSLLPCQDIESSIKISQEISIGRVKKIFRGTYKGNEIVLSYPVDDIVVEDFAHGLGMIIAFQGSGFVPELIGYCKERSYLKMVTKYYKHGSLERLNEQLAKWNVQISDEWHLRIQLAENYLSILEYLHHSPIGTRVMCDTNDLPKTLSQFLITDDYRLIVNDLDALPEVRENGTVKCGHRMLFGEFVAPEQLWPHDNQDFSDEQMPGYNEKTDIWKIPDVLVFLLGSSSRASRLKILLFDLFRSCKTYDALHRPSINEVKMKFESALKLLNSRSDL